jgi:hypothetical protein
MYQLVNKKKLLYDNKILAFINKMCDTSIISTLAAAV